jgi:ribose-phosphate pyrophosphokinase
LKQAGAKSVYASCTHPVLSGPALERIEASAIERLVVTDSINLPEERKIDKIDEISVGNLMAEAIKRIHENKPVSPLFESKEAFIK